MLNPRGAHYAALKAHLAQSYEDAYFGEDAIFMERNSRDFRRRAHLVDANTAAVCALLHAQPPSLITHVFYPQYTTPAHYASCRAPAGGFGGLFSVTFAAPAGAHAFFDALPFYKGPSLGTNFTLACPYAVLAHYGELGWAAGWGVEPELVRVSVGMEERGVLLAGFERALEAARRAAAVEGEGA